MPRLLSRMPQDEEVERLVPAAELVGGLVAAGAPREAIRQHQLGFIPDFAPPLLMPLGRKLEATAERLPLVRRLAAHNVVVAPKNASENWTPPNPPKTPYAVFADDGGYQWLQKAYADAAAGHPQNLTDSCRANS